MILKCKELIYTSENIVIESNVPLSTNIDSGNFALQLYDETGSYVNVDIISATVTGSESVSGTRCTIRTNTLQNNKIYVLTAFAIQNADLTESVPAQVFRFLSVDKPAIYNTNNVFAQLTDIDEILSIEYLLKNKEEYTLEFNPATYNFDSGKYDLSPELVSIQNNKLMLDLLINQYFTEYKPFYDAINNRLSTITYEDSYVNNVHLIFMNNIAKWYSLKGNQSFIEIMLNLYAKYLGYNVLSVVDDPINNFRYRVSSSIPKVEWNKYIKPLVHPMSWFDQYNEITSVINGFYIEPINLKRRMRDSWHLDTISYLDAEAYSKQFKPHYRWLKNIYHSSGNIESYNVSAHEQGQQQNCNFRNPFDQYKFGLNLNAQTTGVDYHQLELYKELKDIKNIKFHIDRFNKTITLDFGLTGVANEYIYTTFNQNLLTNIVESLKSKVTLPYNTNDIFILKLKKNGWDQEVNRIDESAFIQYKQLPLSFAVSNAKAKLLAIRNNNKKAYQYNGLAVSNFNSEGNANSLAYTTDVHHSYAVSAKSVSGAFISEFDTGYTPIKVDTFSVGGVNYKNVKLKYNKAGFLKYKWKLLISGNLVKEETTYFNYNNFVVSESDYNANNATVQLTVYFKNGSYSLNTTSTLH